MLYPFLALLFSCCIPVKDTSDVPVITLRQLQEKTVQPDNDTLYIVNFWATWCGPCVNELPYFEEAGRTFTQQKVKVLLISLDFLSERQKVVQFIREKHFQNEVYLLNAGNPNDWIDHIDSSWSGGIPATIIYRQGKKRYFRESDFSNQQELNTLIQNNLNKPL